MKLSFQLFSALHRAIGVAMVILFGGLIAYVVFGKSVSARSVENLIKKSNYCSVDADCVIVPAKCPLPCSVLVHSSEEETVRQALSSYVSHCVYQCTEPPAYRCQNQRCIWNEKTSSTSQ